MRAAGFARHARWKRAVLWAALLLATPATAQDWRALDPENTLVIDTTKGRMIVEMRPELAPRAVERIKLLTREGVYDGLQFHRVVEGFVAQTGNPNNKDGGVSRHPDLPAEFTFRVPDTNQYTINILKGDDAEEWQTEFMLPWTDVSLSSDVFEGLVGTVPIVGDTEYDLRQGIRAWAAYCTGVAGMGRGADPGTANSEMFFMLQPARRLDHDYAAWGRIVVGQNVLAALARGEPPAEPDRMTRVRVIADLPAAERPRVEVEGEDALRRRIDTLRSTEGANFSVCDVPIVTRVPS